MKRVVGVVAGVCAIACGWLVRPARWEVEGLSMAPGLMPGDVAATAPFPLLDRWRRPQRFERWTLAAPDGALAIKRVWGLPGEEIAIVDGDLLSDGEVLLKPPRVLAEVALPVTPVARHEADGSVRFTLDDPIFDDVPFAPDERRVLVPVRDVGVSAVIEIDRGDGANAPALVEVRVADRAVRVSLRRPGRHALVVGRLDGAFVAAAWPLSGRGGQRSCLPAGGPPAWTIHSPWDESDPVTSLEVRVTTQDGRLARIVTDDVAAWRDVHHLRPASATTQWRLGGDEWFVLGDYPGGSRDSRQWGAVGCDSLHHRVAAPPSE